MILIIVIVITLIFGIILLESIGENGYPHKCINANVCPMSIRCNREKEMECYRGEK